MSLWIVLAQFLSRLAMGMVAALWLIPARQVAAEFYQRKAWILLGLCTVLSLAVISRRELFQVTDVPVGALMALSVSAAVAAYASSVGWLYRSSRAGRGLLAVVGVLTASVAILLGHARTVGWWAAPEAVTSGLLLGGTLTTMLLGHWYLNAPRMELDAIWRMVHWLALSVAARAVVAAIGEFVLGAAREVPLPFLALRWTAGIVLPAVLCTMVRGTLKVPNTQSATGILYAMLVLVVIGELVAQLSGLPSASRIMGSK